MRRRNKGRNLTGILALDKPLGVSSNAALQEVKRMFQARKAGHVGSLDPLATGLLPICFGEATKLSEFLLDTRKRYLAVGRLGEVTSTGDAEGEVLSSRPVPALDRAQIEQVLERFTGEIEQVPPMYSALKYKGQPLYKLARQGIEVERAARRVHVHSLQLRDFSAQTLDIEVVCSRGTYVRTLIEDIGNALGCGAHVVALRRTALGPYGEGEMHTMEELRGLAEQGLAALDALLLPLETALTDWPQVNLSDDAAYYLKRGQAVLVPHAPTRGWVRLFAAQGRFLGLGRILDDGRVAPKRLLNTG